MISSNFVKNMEYESILRTSSCLSKFFMLIISQTLLPAEIQFGKFEKDPSDT